MAVLINDKSWNVREEVAKQGYGLVILVNDDSSLVRWEVAKHGYGLDILVNDEITWISEIAKKQLKLKE